MGLIEWLLLFGLALFWGTSFGLTAIALRELSPFTFAFARVAVAAVTLLFLTRIFRMALPRGWQPWGPIMVTAFFGNVVPFSLIAWGQSLIPSSLAGLLMATGPLFTLVIAHFNTSDERMTGFKTVSLVLGFGAVLVMMGPDAIRGVSSNVAGQLAILGAALCYAIATVYGRRFQAMGLKPLPLAAGQLCVASIMMVPAMVLFDQPWALGWLSTPVILAVLASGVLSTGIPYIMYFRILAVGGATNVMLVTFLVPIVAVTTGSLALGEVLEPRHFMAMGLLALALLSIDGRVFRMFRGGTH